MTPGSEGGQPGHGRSPSRVPVPLRPKWLFLGSPLALVGVLLASKLVLPMHAEELSQVDRPTGTVSPAGASLGVGSGDRRNPGAATPSALTLKARIMERSASEYPTRILAHLSDFEPGEPVELSRYGGWCGQRREARGVFYPERIDGRWWLVDPDGCLFLNIGVNAVQAGTSPQMEKALPVRFGTPEKWRDSTIALLRENGFNGSGAWSDNEFMCQATQRMVYTPNLRFLAAYGSERRAAYRNGGRTSVPGEWMFLFDPEFETFAEEHARQVAALKDDPYLLGYFSDNELPFFPDALEKFLKLDPAESGRKEAESWLAGRREGTVDSAQVTDSDRAAWVGHLGERYFSVVSKALKQHDPNHLYLGSRLHWRALECQPLFEAAGRHLDVVSVNCYGIWDPRESIEQWSTWSGRPVMITEWYAKGDDSGLPNRTGAGWTLATQEERGWFYQHFALAMLESKHCVGWHWFKYIDNDPLDTKVDPSNRDSNKGIVTSSYEPYAPLLSAMRKLNFQVYPLTVYFDKQHRTPGSPGGMEARYQP